MEEYDVVVVGAGLSGLTAADHLKRRRPSAQVCILEARDRVGGRTESLAHAGVDVGAQWIGPAHTEILSLVERFKLQLLEQFYPSAQTTRLTECVGYDQTPLTTEEAIAVQKYVALIEELSSSLSLETPECHPSAYAWDHMSIESHVESHVEFTVSQREILLFAQTVLACTPSQVSFLFFLFYVKSGGGIVALGDGDQGAQRWRVDGGMQQLSQSIAKDLIKRGVDIQFGQTVFGCTREQKTNRLVLEVRSQTGMKRLIQTTKVIWAISPLLFARHVRCGDSLLCHELLQKKLKFGTQMIPGQVAKIIMGFKRAFWLESQNHVAGPGIRKPFVELGPVHNLFHSTLRDGSPALVGLITGEAAEKFRKMSQKERHESIMQQVRLMYFGGDLKMDEPFFYVEKLWATEEFSHGCFAGLCAPNGSFSSLASFWRQPCDNMYFCSTESSTEFYGYMEGAVRNGKRVAMECLSDIHPE